MKKDTRKIVWRIFLMYAAVNTLNYALSHIAYLFVNDIVGEIFEYISYYASLALDFLTAPMLATVMLVLCAREGTGKAFGHMLLISTARLLYTLPYYYVSFIYNYRYDSVEALIISLIASILIIFLSAITSLICFKIAMHFTKRREKKRSKNATVSLPEIVKAPATTDFLNVAGMPLAVFSILSFIFHLLKEIIDTVSFFIEYRSDYTVTEIATILANYILLFLLLVAAYHLCMRLKNRLAQYEIIVVEKPKKQRTPVPPRAPREKKAQNKKDSKKAEKDTQS